MENKKNSKHNKKMRKLILLCLLCGIVLTVSTYAWFIGMKTVTVPKFDIEIATTEGLYLSMNGKDWSYNLDALNAEAYTDNANQWLQGTDEGLIPMSTVGDLDKTSSRMKLFEKGSLTAVPGGARLMASRVNNFTNRVKEDGEFTEGKGYIAFDLFIKNMSGTEYYAKNDPLNEEAIYLTTNSEVKVGKNGKQNTGIENSVRVAFAQIGRVTAADGAVTQDQITGINCTGDVTVGEDGTATGTVTGICRNAQIWEPNDSKHVENALKYYKTSCKERADGDDGKDVTSAVAYGDACADLIATEAYPTYAISNPIGTGTDANNVNIYDGEAFNTYKSNSMDYESYKALEDKSTAKLVDFPYFTDTQKMITGTNRPQFMTLAPNSITKVRVYVWIEGQDIDNYDFASLGEEISINFGFTKEQLTETDVNHQGPSTDITPTPEEESAGKTEHEQAVTP